MSDDSLHREAEAAGRRVDGYLGTVDRMEPNIHPVDHDGAMASIAISLRRIADALEKRQPLPVWTTPRQIIPGIQGPLPDWPTVWPPPSQIMPLQQQDLAGTWAPGQPYAGQTTGFATAAMQQAQVRVPDAPQQTGVQDAGHPMGFAAQDGSQITGSRRHDPAVPADAKPVTDWSRLPRWRCHKIVRAAPIISIEVCGPVNKVLVTVDIDGTSFGAYCYVLSANVFSRGRPEIPSDPAERPMLVVYDDDYVSWSPRKAFDAGYALIDRSDPQEG